MPSLTARQAAQRFHVSSATAQRRAIAAFKAGDPAVEHLAHAWVAPDWWWEQELKKPVPRGRPPKQ